MTSSNIVTITVLCEGKTELFFVKKILNPFFYNSYKIHLLPHDLKGRVTTDKIIKEIKRAKTTIITTLVDYYGFVDAHNRTIEELTSEIKQNFSSKYIVPYIQLHEIEALWFSDIDSIARKMNANFEQKQKLKRIIQSYPNPEDINNSKDTAPSKRLERIFLGYDKPIDGVSIAENIPIEVYMQKCPRFKIWIETIIQMAKELREG